MLLMCAVRSWAAARNCCCSSWRRAIAYKVFLTSEYELTPERRVSQQVAAYKRRKQQCHRPMHGEGTGHACRCMRSSAFFKRSSSSRAFSRQAPSAASNSTLVKGSVIPSAHHKGRLTQPLPSSLTSWLKNWIVHILFCAVVVTCSTSRSTRRV